MVELGYVSLFLALVTALYSAVVFVVGHRQGNAALIRSARNGVIAAAVVMTVAAGVMLQALLTHNFRIDYVASYSSTDMSVPYLISGLWAGNDGSLLFWAWMLALAAMVVVVQKRERARELLPYAGAVLMVTLSFFLVVILTTSNPFRELLYTPAEGNGLNPLLENPGMLFHPPTLLGGYVVLSVPFAFAVAALLTKRLGDEWIQAIRRWTLVAWMLLSAGNILGAWWAYVELNWGGYWAWDPVENASFMPWLVATAFLHSIMMQRRRGMLKIWNMGLVTLAFALSILGTFLTRSGVLQSVHTFSSEPLLGTLLLSFMLASLAVGLGLLWYRGRDLKGDTQMESLLSRESTFLVNNLLLVGVTFATLFGTFFPVISEVVQGEKVTVGPPYFNQVNGPILLVTILLAGVCTLIGWRRASRRNLVKNFGWPVVVAALSTVAMFAAGVRQPYALVSFTIAVFVLATIIYEWVRGTQARRRVHGVNPVSAFWGLITANRPRYGGYIVHIGILLLAVGVVGSSFYDVEQTVVLRQGDSMTINNHTLTFDSMDSYETQSKGVVTTTMTVYDGVRRVGTLTPEKYFHYQYEQPVTEAAVRSNLLEDVYVSLLEVTDDDSVIFKVIVNPLVSWVWIGGAVAVGGGLIAFWPERRPVAPVRPAAREERDAVAEPV
jgi:cytochrome c-type biogenesis protein CcmF